MSNDEGNPNEEDQNRGLCRKPICHSGLDIPSSFNASPARTIRASSLS